MKVAPNTGLRKIIPPKTISRIALTINHVGFKPRALSIMVISKSLNAPSKINANAMKKIKVFNELAGLRAITTDIAENNIPITKVNGSKLLSELNINISS